jgi:hypothetical protein
VSGLPRPRARIVLFAALSLQAIALTWPATLGGQVYFRRDVHLMWLSQSQGYARAFSEGAWPLWNPLASFGQPLLADANAQVLYPTTPLLLALPPWTYYALYVLAHLLLAGLGAALLARRLGMGPLAAWAAGALWMASGPLLSVVDTWNQLAGAAWMPWSIAAGLAALRGRPRGALAWGLASALQLTAGAPEMLLCAWAAVAVLGLAQARRSHLEPARVGRAAAGAAAAAVLTFGLAAGQWIPALDAARRAGRTELSREARTHWSVSPVHLAQSIVPVPLHRLALLPRVREDVFGAPDPFLPSIYLGAVGGLLAAAALGRATRPTLGLAAVALFCALVAMGRHAWLYDLLAATAPPLRAFRYPAKALLLGSLAWSLLAARGLEVVAASGRTSAAAIVGLFVALACAATAWTLAPGGPLARLTADPAATGGAALRVGVAALLAGLAAALALRGARSRAVAVGALALLDLVFAHHDLNPTAPVALYTHVPAALAAARDDVGGRLEVDDYFEPGASRRLLGRDAAYLLARAPVGWDLRAAQALALREALFPPTASLFGVPGSFERDVPGLEPAPVARLKEAFRRAGSHDVRQRLLQVAGVTRVAALHESAGAGLPRLGLFPGYFAEPLMVFESPLALPRTYLVGSARVLADEDAVATLASAEFRPAREVVLASGQAGAAPADFTGTSRVRERRPDRVVLETNASSPGWMVLLEAWDPGWRVHVDGRPASLERANVAFRAVAVPAGAHEVEMLFRPRGLGPALGASAASAVVMAAAWWAFRPRRAGEGRTA